MSLRETRQVWQQETMPVRTENVQSMAAFNAFLQQYRVRPLDLAIAAGVRYLTVWNIQRGIPVRVAHADRVRQGLRQLTGVLYMMPIAALDEQQGR